jgi:hypothetical protein
MKIQRILLLTTTIFILLVPVISGQKRLGPKNRETILDARVDQSFASTPLKRVLFLPFANAIDYQEGAMILTENFIGAMHQKHPDIMIVSPEDTSKIIQEKNLNDIYRSFLGNYNNTGVATMPFLQALGGTEQADGILIGKIQFFGVMKQTTTWGGFSWSKNKAVVGMELTLLRTKDGRELWWGTHGVAGEKNENVRDLAKIVGDVFAAYFGRLPF